MKENGVHPLKEFALKDLSAIWKGRGEGQESRLCQGSPSAALLGDFLSISSCGGS